MKLSRVHDQMKTRPRHANQFAHCRTKRNISSFPLWRGEIRKLNFKILHRARPLCAHTKRLVSSFINCSGVYIFTPLLLSGNTVTSYISVRCSHVQLTISLLDIDYVNIYSVTNGRKYDFLSPVYIFIREFFAAVEINSLCRRLLEFARVNKGVETCHMVSAKHYEV